MYDTKTHRIYPHIRTPEALGIAHLGSPHTAIVPPKHHIDRAEYGRRLAEAEVGIFTSSGYLILLSTKTTGKFIGQLLPPRPNALQ